MTVSAAATDGGVFDYVVVGAGSAGCAVAARLSENGAHSVLLLESGGSQRNWKFRVPGGQAFIKDWAPYAWQYAIEPDRSRGGRDETWRRGRVLGGSSTINGVIYAVGLPRDFDRWAEMGATGWAWADVEPWFRKAERCPDFPQRGQDGPVRVERFRSPHVYTDDLLASFATLGLPIVADINRAAGAAVGIAQTNQCRGLRQDSATAYLDPARARRNLTVWTRTDVERVVLEHGAAKGVVANRAGHRLTVRARREVVLSAGAFGTPVLLLRSGIGPGSDLQALGIDVVVDSPGVGANLHDHPELYVEYEVRDPTYSSAMKWTSMLRTALQFALTRRGQASSCATHVLGYGASEPGLPEPDLLFFAGPWGYLEDVFAFSRDINVFSISPSICHPKSRGAVTLRSADPAAAPRIAHELLGHPDDVALLMRAVRLVDHVASTPAFARHVVRRLQPDFALADDCALEDFVRRTAGICYHASGTCRMGTDAGAVVDPHLKVRGVDRLSVADASVIPLVTSGNLHAPAVMIGERAADLIARRRTPSQETRHEFTGG